MDNYQINHLRDLENESIYIMREVAAQFENPALLFSGGKDSIVMVHLAMKAFWPQRIPFTLVHIDTGHNFDETLVFRDELVEKLGARLVVGSVQESINEGKAVEETVMYSRQSPSSTLSKSTNLMWHSAEAAGMRKKQEPKSASSRTVMSSASGIPRIKGLSYGTSSTAR